jgi:hypothetical protein
VRNGELSAKLLPKQSAKISELIPGTIGAFVYSCVNLSGAIPGLTDAGNRRLNLTQISSDQMHHHCTCRFNNTMLRGGRIMLTSTHPFDYFYW